MKYKMVLGENWHASYTSLIQMASLAAVNKDQWECSFISKAEACSTEAQTQIVGVPEE